MNKDNPFKPAWWLKNQHLQTIFARYMGRKRDIFTRKEVFELPDGDFLDIRWSGGDAGPIVMILHGLEGSVQSHYVKGMVNAATALGWRAAVMHFRSCGESVNRLARGYHSGDTADLAEFVKYLQAKEPNTPILAVGYSMGANVLLKWLGETGVTNPLIAAVAVSVPFELHKAAQEMQRWPKSLYQEYFLKPLREKILLKARLHNLSVDEQTVKSFRSIKEYDDHITAPLHGFDDALDYYLKSSSRYYLKNIQVPTLIIQAKDDPFMTEDMIPRHDELSPQVHLEVYDRGGHVGFVSGRNPFKPEYWLESRIPKFMVEQLHALKRPWRVA